MAFSSTTIQPVTKHDSYTTTGNSAAAALLSLLVLSVYGAQKSSKYVRSLKRKAVWTALKENMKSLFVKPAQGSGISTRTILIILLAALVLVLLLTVSTPVALGILALGILLILLVRYR